MAIILHSPKAISQRHSMRQPINGARIMAAARAEAETPQAQAERATAISDQIVGDWPPPWTLRRVLERIRHDEILGPLCVSVATWIVAILISLGFWYALVAILVSWP
jgi:hypothetical protein